MVTPTSQACVLTNVLQPVVKIRESANALYHRILKEYWRVEVKLNAFLTVALNETYVIKFTPHWRGPRARLDPSEEGNNIPSHPHPLQGRTALNLVTTGTKTPKFSFIDCNKLKWEGLRVCNSGILTLYLVKNCQFTQALKWVTLTHRKPNDFIILLSFLKTRK